MDGNNTEVNPRLPKRPEMGQTLVAARGGA